MSVKQTERMTDYDDRGNPYFCVEGATIHNAGAAKMADYENIDPNPAQLKVRLEQAEQATPILLQITSRHTV